MNSNPRSRRHLFDQTLEGYCMVFNKKTKFCELQVERGKGSDADILKVNRDTLTNDEYWNSKFNNMEDLLRGLREDKDGRNKKHYIDYRIIESKYDKEHIYVVISCEESIIEKWAQDRTIDVPIDAKRAIKIAKEQLPDFLLAKRTKLDDDDDNKYTTDHEVKEDLIEWHKWENIHIGYESILHKNSKHINIFATPLHTRTLHPVASAIPHILYLRILYEILTDDIELGGAGFVIDKYLENKSHPLCQFYALHQTEAQVKMRKAFSTFKCVGCTWHSQGWNTQFLDGIRRYYGEQIAFYFAFLVHYTVWLYPLAIIGTIWYIISEATEDMVNGGSVVAVFIIILWSTFMIENWFRREWKLRYRWGMMRYQHTEIPRPAFKGKYIISSVNGMRIETHKSKCLHWFRRIVSVCLSFLCVLLVIAATVLIWNLQNAARNQDEYLSIVIGMINSVQILLFNKMFSSFAVFLNDWEEHRLQEEYYNQLVMKRISFIVINSFYSLFYIAFFDERPEYDDNTVRLEALRTQLIVLFVMAIFYQNTMEVLCQLRCTRRCRNCCSTRKDRRSKKEKRKVDDDESVELITSDSNMESIDDDDGYIQNHSILTETNIKDIMHQSELYISPDVLDNTAEIIVLHGYVTLFIVVFPLMPLLGVLNNYVELLVDKYNLLNTQRPVPWSAGGLGVWSTVLSVFAVVSIYSNLALVTFRTNIIIDFLIAMEDLFADFEGIYWTNGDMMENQVTFFFVSTTFFVFVVVGIRMCIPPISGETADDIARQEICQRELLHLNKQTWQSQKQ